MVSVFNGLGEFQGVAALGVILMTGVIVATFAAQRVRSASMAVPVVLGVVADLSYGVLLRIFSPGLSYDEVFWHNSAIIASRIIGSPGSGGDIALGGVEGKEGYVWLLGAMYAVGGEVPTLGIVLNVITHALIIVTVALTTESIAYAAGLPKSEVAHKVTIAGLLVAVLPCFVVWVPMLLRESLTLLFLSLAMMIVTKGLIRRNLGLVLGAALPLLVVYAVRGTLGAAVIGAFIVAGLIVLAGRSRYRIALWTALCVAMAVILPIGFGPFASELGISEASVALRTADLAASASSGFPGIEAQASWVQILTITAPRVILGPFPWEINTSGVMVLALVEWVCWVLVAFFALRAWRCTKPGAKLSLVRWLVPFSIFVGVAILLGLTLIVANYGILARFRPIVTILLIPLAALAWPFDTQTVRARGLRTSKSHTKDSSRINLVAGHC